MGTRSGDFDFRTTIASNRQARQLPLAQKTSGMRKRVRKLKQFLDGSAIGHGENFAGQTVDQTQLPEVEEEVQDRRS